MGIDWRAAAGPWNDEPDYAKWEAHGVICEIKRNLSMGNLCGYVTVPEGHPWFGQDYDYIKADVHGGLTYGAMGKDGYTVGFDCAHAFDLLPLTAAMGLGDGTRHYRDTYRDWTFVKDEVERLAAQAAVSEGDE